MPPDKTQYHTLENRYSRVRSFLKQEGLGGLFAYSPAAEHKWGQTGHVSYLSGWANHDRIVDTAVVVPSEGSPALLVAGLPYMLDQIPDASCIENIRLVQSIDPNAVAVEKSKDPNFKSGLQTFAGATQEILNLNGLNEEDVGVVGIENMSVPFYESLVYEFGGRLKRSKDIIADMRSTKEPDEMALIRHSAHLGDLGFETLLSTAKPGMLGIEIIAEMERVVRKEGADHAKYWMASGPPTTWEDTKLDIKPHERVLNQGDMISVCSYIVYKGYWSHGHRTGSLGTTSGYLKRITGIARDSQDAGLAAIRSGARAGDIAKAVREKSSEYGWKLEGGRVGHGIGLDYSEIPIPSESNNTILKPGMTLVLHSAFSLPESGKMFVPLGDHVRVTQDSPEFLMQFPRTPFEI
jgi:Xaa-Pro aminopeptidase